jgi:hypothetical protein
MLLRRFPPSPICETKVQLIKHISNVYPSRTFDQLFSHLYQYNNKDKECRYFQTGEKPELPLNTYR